MITLKKILKLGFVLTALFLFYTSNVFADATVSVDSFYNLNTGETCSVASPTASCQQFMNGWGGNRDWLMPTQNNLSSTVPGVPYTYGGWGQAGTVSTQTDVGSSYVESSLAVAWIPSDLSASSATYLCTGPGGGVTMRSVPATLDSGGKAGFASLDVTGRDCTVTLNFNQVDANSGGGSGGGGGYSCQSNSCVVTPGGPFSEPTCSGLCQVDIENASSISISVNPSSRTVDYGVNTTSYFDVVVTKTGNFGANIIPNCEVFVTPGAGGGECAFVDNSNNPLPRTLFGQPAGSAAFTRYPSRYIDPGVSSITLRLAVRNYDQYGGRSAIKTHVIPVEAALIKESGSSGPHLVCNGSCTVFDNANLIVQSPAVCVPTNSVNATSPAAANRTFTLSWAAVTDAVNYTVEVRDQTSCVQPGCGPLILNTTTNGTSVSVPYGGDIVGVTNKRFGYVIATNYSPSRNSCSSTGAVLVSGPTGGGTGGSSGSVSLLCNGSQNVTINSGQDCNLTWTSVNTVANSCVASGSWSGGGKATSGSQNMPNITSNKSYTLTCDVVGGGTAFGTTNVSVTGTPSASCPASTPYLNLDKTQISQGESTQVRVPAGYTCPSFSSSNPGVVSVSGSSVTGNFNGSASISTSGCTFSGSACPVNPVSVTVQSPAFSNSFSLSPASLNFSATLNSSTGALDPVACQNINITNTSPVGSGNFTVAPTYYVEYNNFPVFSIDNQVSASGRYQLADGSFVPSSGSICILDNPSIQSPGNYQEVITYAGYPSSGTNKITEEKTLTINLNVSGSVCSSGSVLLNPGSIQQGGSTSQATTPGFTGCSFGSSNTGVATVNGSGVVTSGASSGSSSISASNCTQTSNGATGCSLSPATILVTGSNPNYSFTVSSALVFSSTEGVLPSPSTRTITVTNNGDQTLNITRTYNMTTSGVNWGSADSPSFSLAPGASRVVNVSITSSMSPATYDGVVEFSDPNAGQKAVPVTYTVGSGSSTRTINVSSNWCGIVTSSPGGINCGASCSAGFDYDDTVTLTAIPNTQCLFIGWLGDCAGQDATCDLIMTSNRSATPIFGLKPFDYEEF